MLIIAGKVDEGTLYLRTVNRILNQYGYNNESFSISRRLYVKHEKDRINAMWQSDVMSALYIPDGKNGSKLAYLIGIIDDYSRRDMHSEFYLDSMLPRLEDTIRKAVTKYGAPESCYVDNGKISYQSNLSLFVQGLELG